MTADFIGEPLAGTCGVGTCISTGQTLTMHQGDHFDAPHILPTCTTSKMFDGRGRLNAVLDISALRSPHSIARKPAHGAADGPDL